MRQERSYWIDEIEGQVPKGLVGTYFRNGPGLIQEGRHVFDGDGMVFRIAFPGDGRAHFRNRFVRTAGFLSEQNVGSPFMRTPFSKRPEHDTVGGRSPLDLTRFKNVANTGVLYWGNRLFAMYETGKPHELDPVTLYTIGESDLGGALRAEVPLGGHYRVLHTEDGRRRWVAFSVRVRVFSGAEVTFYEFDESGTCVEKTGPFPLGAGVTFVHDLAVTQNHYVLALGPVKFDWIRFFTEYVFSDRCSIAQCLRFVNKGGTKVVVVPRGGGGTMTPIAPIAPIATFPFHHANAFETSCGSLVLDTVGWESVDFDDPDFFKRPTSSLLRLRVDLGTGKVSAVDRLTDPSLSIEFPSVNPLFVGRQHTRIYCVAHSAKKLMRISIRDDDPSLSIETDDVWDPGPRRFCAEPIVIPKPGAIAEDDAWIVMGVHDAATDTAEIAVFDASHSLDRGPIATLHLKHRLPVSFHGSFTTTYLGPPLLENGDGSDSG